MVLTSEQMHQYKLDLESRALFVKICALDQPIAVTAAEFEKLLKQKYGKRRLIKPTYLYKWACQGKQQPQNISKYFFSAAIDYLVSKQETKILHLIPLKKFVRHWFRPRVEFLSLTEALRQFKETFQPNNDELKQVESILKELIEKHKCFSR